MTTATAAKTGTIRISPPHRAGNMNTPCSAAASRSSSARDWTQPPPICTYLTEHDGGLILLDSAAKGWFPWWNPCFQFAVDIRVEPGDEIGPGCGRGG